MKHLAQMLSYMAFLRNVVIVMITKYARVNSKKKKPNMIRATFIQYLMDEYLTFRSIMPLYLVICLSASSIFSIRG